MGGVVGARRRVVLWAAALGATVLVALVAAGSASAAVERSAVIIRYASPPTGADISALERAGARIEHRYSIVPAVAASMPDAAVDGLRRNPRVEEVEPDQVVRALDYRSTHDWGIGHVKADLVHAATTTDFDGLATGVRIAILDSGIDCDHAELPKTRCVYKENYISPGVPPDDDWGHGTHVAGSAGATRDAGVSTGVVGVAPGAGLLAYKVLDDQGYGTISDVTAAVDHIWKNGTADVVNMSLGWSSGSTTFQQAMDNAYASGLVLVAAAGNGGRCSGKGNTVSYPAKYASVIAVAAVDQSNARPCWSSTGEEVELSAPGVSVFSTWPSDMSTSYRDPQPVCEGSTCHFKYGSGTSMSVPHVAGAAALVIGSGTVTDGNGARGIADEVRARLASTAVTLGDATLYGHGLIDAQAATTATTDTGGDTGGGTDGGTTSISLSVTGYKHRGDKHIDLVWSGATTETVDIWRDGQRIHTATANDGAEHDHPPKGSDTHTYRVCEAGTDTCSNDATITL